MEEEVLEITPELQAEIDRCMSGDFDYEDMEQVERCMEIMPPTGAGIEVSPTSFKAEGSEWFIIVVLLIMGGFFFTNKWMDRKAK